MKLLTLLFLILPISGYTNMSDDLKNAYKMAKQMDSVQEEENSAQRELDIDNFLSIIGQIESSGGTNFDHAEIQDGMHEGHRAAGTYGLMPNTIDEILNRMRLQGEVNPNLQSLSEMSPEEKKLAVENNPDMENALARSLANRVLDNQNNDEEKAAYSWFQGHNMSPQDIDEQDYQNHDYVKKYNKFKKIKDTLGE